MLIFMFIMSSNANKQKEEKFNSMKTVTRHLISLLILQEVIE